MVKDIRSLSHNKGALDHYVSSELQNIKTELKKNETRIKSSAVSKLII